MSKMWRKGSKNKMVAMGTSRTYRFIFYLPIYCLFSSTESSYIRTSRL